MIGSLVVTITNFYHPSLAAFGDPCTNINKTGNFLGFPHWYEYIKTGKEDAFGNCSPAAKFPDDIWLIMLAIIDIMLRLAGILAVIFIIIAGFNYIVSRGEPDKTASARRSIIHALVGLIITIFAAAIVNFVGRSFN